MIYEFKFPDVGEGVHEGKILKLNFKSGDEVEAGDILAVVETDKVVAEIPSSKDGVLKRYGGEEGQIIHVGDVLAYIEIEGEAIEPKKEVIEEAGSVVGEIEAGDTILPASGEGISDHDVESVTLKEGRRKVLATPVARKMARDLGIDISKIKGTGPAGRVMKQDIVTASKKSTEVTLKAEKKPEKVASTKEVIGETQMFELSTIRKTIAANMEESQNIPAFVVQDFVVIDDLVEFRKKINEGRESRISFQPFFMKAIAAALKKYPILNASFAAEKKEVTLHKNVNIGLAVNTDDGLMVPVIKNVQSKSIEQINDEMKELAELAKDRKIKLDDMRGGTISITNYGSFGGVYGRPMILPPQVAILGFGRMHQAPMVKNGDVVPSMVLPVSMTCDHRVVDGVPAASFLTYFFELLENIEKLLISI